MIYARIEERPILPTDAQAHACLRVCQMLSSYYQNVQLFRFDPLTQEVYIFSSEAIQILVPTNGLWEFIPS
ncbi:DUF6888 family protein [Phormidesmis sp. 146-33]